MFAQNTNSLNQTQSTHNATIPETDPQTYRRSNKRLKYSAEVLFSSDAIITKGMTKDLSAGGAAIQSLEIPAIGDVLIVSIPYAQKQRSVRRRAVVRWVEGKIFGIEFT